MRASGFLPSLAACFAVISTTAAAPSLMPDALPAVTVPSFSNAGRSLAIASSGHAVPRILVGIDDDVALAALDRDRDDLVLEPAGLLRGFGLVLRGDSELVLLLRG